jgi:uncharacterized protein (TIGR02147 family)
MKDTLFGYQDYKRYLNDRLDDPVSSGGRGARARLARATRCQTPYVAQVLRGSAHFSLEQAESINGFFGHSEAEGDFFLLLLQFCRATSPTLRARLKRQLQNLKEQNLNLKNRFANHPMITDQAQAIYYSSWIYGAIHALASIPGFQNVESIALGLKLAPPIVGNAVDFLLACGIFEKKQNQLKIGKWRLHLANDSPWIAQHHLNWRLRAMQSIEKTRAKDGLHYSSVVSVSEADAEKIHELLIQSLQTVREIVRASPEEKLRSFCVDWFEP